MTYSNRAINLKRQNIRIWCKNGGEKGGEKKKFKYLGKEEQKKPSSQGSNHLISKLTKTK